MHLRRHLRFYVALGVGLAVWAADPAAHEGVRFLLAADAFFLSYIGLMALFALRLTPGALRRRGAENDEGVLLILALSALAVASSLFAIFVVLNLGGAANLGAALLAVASVPLGWGMIHTMAAFHYATIYYQEAGDAGGGGLAFPGAGDPGPVEFVYFAFVLGMAAQVSDVQVLTTRMRRAVLVHSTASFFYNTVLLALAVNAALTFAAG
jgi:uncharacterized membrane protein